MITTESLRAELTQGRALRWGIAGPGVIASAFTEALHRHTNHRVTAVASRSADRARDFATKAGVERALGSYDELTRSDVDAIYVATINAAHLDVARGAIEAGIPVLVEKPFAISTAETEEVVRSARTAGVFAMEAMWSRYLPRFRRIAELMAGGDLGEVVLASADVGWRIDPEPGSERLRSGPGSGVVLDMGVYGLWFAQFALRGLGPLTGFLRGVGGIDETFAVAIRSTSGALGLVSASMEATAGGRATIIGRQARISIDNELVFPGGFTLRSDSGEWSWHDETGVAGRDGLAWQAVALSRFLDEGRTESPFHDLDATLDLARSMEEARSLPDSP